MPGEEARRLERANGDATEGMERRCREPADRVMRGGVGEDDEVSGLAGSRR